MPRPITSEESTPTRLLALQRLADFPERAELRTAREERQLEMHIHKLEMNAHRKHITEERLNLAKKSYDLRERLASNPDRNPNPHLLPSLPPGHYLDANGRECDHLGPLPASIDDGDAISARARKKFGIKETGRTDASSVESGASPEAPLSPTSSNLSDCVDPASVVASLQGARAPETHFTPANRNGAEAIIELHRQAEKRPSPSSAESNRPIIQTSTNPSELAYRPGEKNSETETSFASLPSVPDPPPLVPDSTSHLELRPSDLAISHAIRRWRAYQPRRYQDPEPTNSWNDECPCGLKIPCERHPELWGFARYLKPTDPKYAAALKQAGIPNYIPTNEELTRSEPTDMPCTSIFYVKKPPLKKSLECADTSALSLASHDCPALIR